MKIVDVSEFYAERGGGVRTYVHHKLQAAARSGASLVVIAPGPQDREEQRLGGHVIWVKSPTMPLDSRYYALCRQRAVHEILDRERPDVVEGSSAWSAGWMVARYRGAAAKSLVYHQDPVAVYAHTLLDRRILRDRIDVLCRSYWRYLERLSRRFDAVVVAGRWLAKRLARHGIRRATAVPFGIDSHEIAAQPRDSSMRRELLARCGIEDEDGRLLLCVGRHHPEKRVATLLAGFRRAAHRMYPKRVGLVIVGDGPQRGWVERRAAQIPGVHVAGFIAERARLGAAMAGADALLHGSAAETYGLVVAEAVAVGLPVVVPSAGGAAELARPAYAETYPPGDAAACADAIVRLLDRDAETLHRAALAARAEVVAPIDEHFARLLALYERLTRQRRASERGRTSRVLAACGAGRR